MSDIDSGGAWRVRRPSRLRMRGEIAGQSRRGSPDLLVSSIGSAGRRCLWRLSAGRDIVSPAARLDICVMTRRPSIAMASRPSDICRRRSARCSRATSSDARLRRDVRADGPARAHCRALLEALHAASHTELRPASDGGRQGVSDAGHHVHGLRRRSGHRADLSLRPAAAHHHRAPSGARSSAA